MSVTIPEPGHDRTALIADDEADLRLVVRRHLVRVANWRAVEAADGTAALETCRRQRVDLVILDQRMPDLTGIEVARTLIAERFDAPIVLFSAYLDTTVEEEAAQLGLVTIPKSDIRRLADFARALSDGASS